MRDSNGDASEAPELAWPDPAPPLDRVSVHHAEERVRLIVETMKLGDPLLWVAKLQPSNPVRREVEEVLTSILIKHLEDATRTLRIAKILSSWTGPEGHTWDQHAEGDLHEILLQLGIV